MSFIGRVISSPLTLLILAAVLLTSAVAWPDESSPLAMDAGATAAGEAAPTVPALPAPGAKPDVVKAPHPDDPEVPAPTVDELVKQVSSLKDEIAEYRSMEGGGKKLALFALIAAICQVLLGIAKKSKTVSEKWGKHWVPRIAIGLSAAIALFSMLGAGQPLLDSVLYGVGPWASVFFHEVTKRRPKVPPPPLARPPGRA